MGPTDTPIALDGSGSTAAVGTLVSYAWDLDGDGSFDDATGATASFMTADAGTHTVALRVTDDSGSSNTDTASVEVAAPSEIFEGYNLYTQRRSMEAYLMDNEGTFVHTWTLPNDQGNTIYLLESGELLIAGGDFVTTLDWNSNVTWFFDGSATGFQLHHDVEWLPNGNVLMIARQTKTADEAIAAGRNPALLTDIELWTDGVIEVDPNTNQIVWQWFPWDHLIQDFDDTLPNYGVVADHPELIDLNFGNVTSDWHHTNAVDYNATLDQIVLSVRDLNEIWIIDHSTTTAEAASNTGGNSGVGGRLLYRWGNPAAYGAGTASDQKLFLQHDARWIEDGLPGAGNILIFSNGVGRPGGEYSTIEEITPPLNQDGSYTLVAGSAYGPTQTAWSYTNPTPTDFYARALSGAHRLPNGNTLICNGVDSFFFEVTPAGETVWDHDALGQVFRVTRFAPTYVGFIGGPLDPAAR